MDSFLVQVWVAADGTSRQSQLRGVVRHVATGAETKFRNDEEVLVVLRQAQITDRFWPVSVSTDQDVSTKWEEVE